MNWLNKTPNNTVFIVPARLGSTRIENKVLNPFANTTLFEIALNNLTKIKSIPKENILIVIRDQELIDKAKEYEFNIFHRSLNSLKDPITLKEVYEWYNKIPQEYYIRLNICNPLITPQTIDDFIQKFYQVPKGLFAVLKRQTFFFDQRNKLVSYFNGDLKYLSTLETKLVEPLYEAAHTLYAGKCSDIDNNIYMGSFLEQNDPSFFELNNEEFGDIDEQWQFDLYEQIYLRRINNGKNME